MGREKERKTEGKKVKSLFKLFLRINPFVFLGLELPCPHKESKEESIIYFLYSCPLLLMRN